ncbi:cation-translocating P-type ATPase [Paracoccus benzoatiresistens]|uniref:Cation-transporting P-type ATPase n=1 Tax=Paracoccus benzoatiresistens TaxID=2997341 RepID=A0ABT4J698_9RHOB|nr:cation-transporting P-type ATPase [Paracoccus sp. EF6]MCZ0962658.1 cation-transporting P-type ATPase [Paracoccus sp. EF6]
MPHEPTATETGLASTEVARLRAIHGPNRLPAPQGRLWTKLVARQVLNPMVALLAVAALVAVLVGERVEALAIMAVVFVNGALGIFQEWRAETALAALDRMLAPVAQVVRDGRLQQIAAEELVPGDLVRLGAGESVPADIALGPGSDLQVDESALTGESVPVDRGAGEMTFQGTLMLTGHGEGRVTATGAATRFGHIAAMTVGARRLPGTLEARVARLSRLIGLASLLVAIVVLGFGIWLGETPATMVMTATALAVAIVPEGLPAVLTLSLALGASMLARQRALVRRLPALETLGAATVICTDKTGTLTSNQMTAVQIWTPTGSYEVTGPGDGSAGHITAEGEQRHAAGDPILAGLLVSSRLCNSARLEGDEKGGWRPAGSPTDAALLVMALKGKAPEPGRGAVVDQIPFSSTRKRMSVLVKDEEGYVLHAKGAPEIIVAISDHHLDQAGIAILDDAARSEALAAYRDMAAQGLRVIALASRRASEGDTLEEGMTFLGFVGLIDPPRPEVPAAIAACRRACVRVVMITGDGPETAAAVARTVGLGSPPVLTGSELDALTDDEFARILETEPVLARVRPEDKSRVVRVLQAAGEVVAMTGDGVNDAPALKAADIGIAMGQRGTEVARQAADMVLLDDNFATIIQGIAEGRRQFDNIRKVVLYLLCSNLGEVVALAASLLLGWPLLLSVPQLLWINLVTDSVVALALGFEAREAGQMTRPPQGRGARLLDARGMGLILGFGLYGGLATLWIYGTVLPGGETEARSAAFTALAAIELATVFAFRSLRVPVLLTQPLSNPVLLAAVLVVALLQLLALTMPLLQNLLGAALPGPEVWLRIVLAVLPLLLLPELVKLLGSYLGRFRFRLRPQ